jgi:hypothetical protein
LVIPLIGQFKEMILSLLPSLNNRHRKMQEAFTPATDLTRTPVRIAKFLPFGECRGLWAPSVVTRAIAVVWYDPAHFP